MAALVYQENPAMHGLVNRSFQLFVSDTFGREVWERSTQVAGISFVDFEGMLTYKETYTPRLIEGVSTILDRPAAEVLEDFGTFIVSHPKFEAVRRLLRFGGVDFVDFLHSLDDLDDRVRLALKNLNLPNAALHAAGENQFLLLCENTINGYCHVMIGVLRAMADDYGALVLLEHRGTQEDKEVVFITVVESNFAEGRHFSLGGGAYADAI